MAYLRKKKAELDEIDSKIRMLKKKYDESIKEQ